jgi:hypothetical protein
LGARARAPARLSYGDAPLVSAKVTRFSSCVHGVAGADDRGARIPLIPLIPLIPRSSRIARVARVARVARIARNARVSRSARIERIAGFALLGSTGGTNVVAVANAKGGSGETTTTVHLAAASVERGTCVARRLQPARLRYPVAPRVDTHFRHRVGQPMTPVMATPASSGDDLGVNIRNRLQGCGWA